MPPQESQFNTPMPARPRRTRLLTLFIILALVGLYLVLARSVLFSWPFERPTEDGELCIQVITPARNPETGEVRDFPTPCDVPEGWEIIPPRVLN